MPDASAKKSKASFLEFVLVFGLLFFVTQTAINFFSPKPLDPSQSPIALRMQSRSVKIGNDPVLIITNRGSTDLTLPKRCPAPPVEIGFVEAPEGGAESIQEIIPNENVLPCTDLTTVKAGGSAQVNLAGWKYALFSRTGTYQASLELPATFVTDGKPSTVSVRFAVVEPGFFTKVFRTFVTKPLFNALIFIGTWVPGHNLGLSIILLTLLTKILLLIPNEHALEGQRKIQELQPRMDEIKRKYPDDPTRVQEETMKLWKEMKINPLQSCLPTLLQLPILIGLFYVIRDGAQLATARHLVYSFYASLPPAFFGQSFLWMDLLKPDRIVLPLLLVVLQFVQMRMMMKKKKSKDEIIVAPAGRTFSLQSLDQQTIMTAVLPLMIGYFALTFPAAVSLYWGVSTLFGIGQQAYVMKKKA